MMKKLLLAVVASLSLAACFGEEFTVGSSEQADAQPGLDSSPDSGEAAVETGDEQKVEASSESGEDVDAANDALLEAAEDSADEAEVDAAEEASVDAPVDAAEEPEADAAEDVAVDSPEEADVGLDAADDGEAEADVVTDVHEAGQDATDAPLDTDPLPPCDIIPPTGWWVCYVLEHSGTPQGFVGLSGGIVPPGQSIESYWNDPMNGEANTKCISPSNLLDYVLCPLGALDSDTRVQFIAALHPNPNDGLMAGTQGCDTVACSGEAYIYHNGVVVGKMLNSTPDGVLDFIPNFTPPNRLNLYFDVQ